MYSIFLSIIRAAILTSQTTSAVGKRQELGVELIAHANHRKLDFGALSPWQNIFITEDGPEVEYVEMFKS